MVAGLNTLSEEEKKKVNVKKIVESVVPYYVYVP